MIVLPIQVAVAQAHKAFSDDGVLIDERAAGRLAQATGELVDVLGRLGQ